MLVVRTKRGQSSAKLLKDGWHTVSLIGISEEDSKTEGKDLKLKFYNSNGYTSLWLPNRPQSHVIMGKIAYIAGFTEECRLTQLIDCRFKIEIKLGQIVKIKKP